MEVFRLYTAHYRPDPFVDVLSRHFHPIQAGAQVANFDMGVLRDDSTEPTISARNDRYSELTATYWMMQQDLPDYVGLMHYRRIFLARSLALRLSADLHYAAAWAGCRIGVRDHFNETLIRKKLYQRQEIDDASRGLIDFLKKNISKADMVLPMRGRLIGTDARKLYARSHFARDFDTMFEILSRRFPEMQPSIAKVGRYRHNYLFNIFIFRREIFLEYARRMFDVFFEMEKNMDLSSHVDYQTRIFGFLAERFMVVFADHVIRTQGARLMELPVAKLIEPPEGAALP